MIVIVRWNRGSEKVSIGADWTVGDLVDYMWGKYGFNKDGVQVLQESTKEVLQRRLLIANMGIENGEIFLMNVSGYSVDPVKTEKSGLITFDEISKKHPFIRVQKFEDTQIKMVLFPQKDHERISALSMQLRFSSIRVFLCFGTRPKLETIRVHSVAFCSQKFGKDGLELNETHFRCCLETAKILGIELVGLVVVNSRRETVFHPQILHTIGKIYKITKKHIVLLSAFASPMAISTQESNELPCNIEAYSLSDQFYELYINDFFVKKTTNESLITVSTVGVESKSVNEVNSSFFLVPIAIRNRVSWFPRSRFPFQFTYPTVSDLIAIHEKEFDVPNFVRYLDFNLLLYLNSLFSPQEMKMIIETIIAKGELAEGILSKFARICESAPSFR